MASQTDLIQRLYRGLLHVQHTPCRKIASPPSQPRRASVAIILRVAPNPNSSNISSRNASAIDPTTFPGSAGHLRDFFQQEWVQHGRPEVLFIKRAQRTSDRWSAHVAFPGGRQEPEDEDDRYTCMRETWEEVGIDLAEKEYLYIGQIDDREITSSLGKRLLMTLSPFVFLQTTPYSPPPEPSPAEVASVHWIPLDLLYTPDPKWGTVTIDLSARLAPRSKAGQLALKFLLGNMYFKCILLPNEPVAVADGLEMRDRATTPLRQADRSEKPELRLWGLTLGMTLDLITHMASTTPVGSPRSHQRSLNSSGQTYPLTTTSRSSTAEMSKTPIPSLASIFPVFDWPDVNFWVWMFSWRYRRVVKTHNLSRGAASASSDAHHSSSEIGISESRRANWTGLAISYYYAAIRKALVAAVVARALGALFLLIFTYRAIRTRRQRRIATVA